MALKAVSEIVRLIPKTKIMRDLARTFRPTSSSLWRLAAEL